MDKRKEMAKKNIRYDIMKKFKKVFIEITNKCNLSCDFCPKTSRQLKTNEEEDFKIILSQIATYTDYIYLHVMGEPTSHKHLGRYLELSYEAGLKVNLTTNGTLLKEVKEVLLNSKSLRQVNISLHSFESNSGAKSLDEYLEGICDFVLEASTNTSIISSIRLWNMDDEELKGKNTLNRDIIKRLEDGLKLDYSIEKEMGEDIGFKVANRIYLNKAKKFEWPDINGKEIGDEAFCYGLRDQIGILVDGSVVPCCLDHEGDMKLGNVFERPLEEILESDRATTIYEGFSNRKAVEKLCKTCGYAHRRFTI